MFQGNRTDGIDSVKVLLHAVIGQAFSDVRDYYTMFIVRKKDPTTHWARHRLYLYLDAMTCLNHSEPRTYAIQQAIIEASKYDAAIQAFLKAHPGLDPRINEYSSPKERAEVRNAVSI